MELSFTHRLIRAETLGEAVAKATLVSSTTSVAVMTIYVVIFIGDRSGYWAVPILILLMSVLLWPFFAFCIVVGGLPVTWVFRRQSKWWGWAAIGPIIGAIGGNQMLNLTDIVGPEPWYSLDAYLNPMGLALGGWAGLVFWWYGRSALSPR